MEAAANGRRPQDRDGWIVMDAGLEEAKVQFGPRLQAAFAIGSLAHGGFSPSSSDVDLALILTDLMPSDAQAVQQIGAELRREASSPLTNRLSVFWSTWSSLAAGEGEGRFPLADRHDLAFTGVCLLGQDERSSIRLPHDEGLADALVIEGAAFIRDKLISPERNALLRSPSDLVALGCREVTKAVLFPSRFLFTLAEGRPAGNEEAADFMSKASAPIAAVVAAAYQARITGNFDPATMEAVLAAGLPPLYDELSGRYAERLERQGEPRLAEALLSWGTALRSG